MKMKHSAANSKSILRVTARVDLSASHRVLRGFPPCFAAFNHSRWKEKLLQQWITGEVLQEFLSHVAVITSVVLGPWHRGWRTGSPIDLKIEVLIH